jgi:hypothetical protein
MQTEEKKWKKEGGLVEKRGGGEKMENSVEKVRNGGKKSMHYIPYLVRVSLLGWSESHCWGGG